MTKFADLNLSPKVLKAVEETGYETPTPIQAGAIPPALEGRDVLGIAQTGTGKTASFTLPMITKLARGRARARMPRSLVLAPTRELAAQVAANFDTYAKHVKLTKALLIGGVSFKEQDLLIDKGVDVLIATPGRLLDHFERGKLLLTGIEIMVVDEADRMLDMGFIPDIERIFEITQSSRRQTLFFSATMAPEIERITRKFLNDPAKVEVERGATAGENIAQSVVMFTPSRRDKAAAEKRALLRSLIDGEGTECKNGIVFCNRKIEVDAVAKDLVKNGYDAAPIHGDLDQSVRMATLAAFRDDSLRFLVASDVAARGLDIPAVSHVFNFDVPSHAEDYVHRIGRTGRAGLSGRAIMICAPNDAKNLDDVERLLKTSVPRAGGTEAAEAAVPATAPVQPEPAVLAEDAPEPKRSRTRGGRGRKPKVEEAHAAEPAASAPSAEPAPAPPPVPVEAAPSAPIVPVPVPAPAPVVAPEPQEERGGRRSRGGRGRSGGRPDDDGGRAVVGMGDHLPGFIELSFEERLAT